MYTRNSWWRHCVTLCQTHLLSPSDILFVFISVSFSLFFSLSLSLSNAFNLLSCIHESTPSHKHIIVSFVSIYFSINLPVSLYRATFKLCLILSLFQRKNSLSLSLFPSRSLFLSLFLPFTLSLSFTLYPSFCITNRLYFSFLTACFLFSHFLIFDLSYSQVQAHTLSLYSSLWTIHP